VAPRRLEVGGLAVEPVWVLAPMAGVTDMAYRRLVRECNPGAVGLVVSEFISVEGLTRNDLKSHRMLRHHPSEHPVGIQIFGGEIDRMAEAASLVQATGVDLVDINCGCPVPKVVKRGGGAELLRRTSHLERMLRAIRRELSVPLTLKIRVGWDDDSINCVEVAQMAEAAGVAMITVHGRTRVQLYAGRADWERIGAVKRAVGIPVVGSGDVVDAASARARLESGVDGLAIARGALENPWVFSEIEADARGETRPAPTAEDRIRALERYRVLLDEMYPERVTAARLRGMACRMTRGFPGSAALRNALGATKTSDELLGLLARFPRVSPAPCPAAATRSTSARSTSSSTPRTSSPTPGFASVSTATTTRSRYGSRASSVPTDTSWISDW
jgi:nifR3 family TIM-barrel protein